MEVDGGDKVVAIAETAGCVLDPLDLGIDGFAACVGDTVLEAGKDVFKPVAERGYSFANRLESGTYRPVPATVEMVTCGAEVTKVE